MKYKNKCHRNNQKWDYNSNVIIPSLKEPPAWSDCDTFLMLELLQPYRSDVFGPVHLFSV